MAAPNPSIERTLSGRSGAASHVKRSVSQMPLPQFVRLTGSYGQPFYVAWEADRQEFLSLDGCTQWSDWTIFKAALRADWDATVDEGGSHTDQRFLEYLQRYERNAPKNFTAPLTAAESRDRERKTSREIWIVGGVLSFFLLVVGSLLWEQGIAPVLGRLGLIEYKTPSQERYQKFLAEVQDCQPQKTVSIGAENGIPPFQVFICPGGQEKVWAHKIKVVKRSANGSWVLEP